MNPKLRKFLAVALPILSSVGVVTSCYLSAKATPKMEKELQKVKKIKDDKTRTVETVKAFTKCYWPSIVTGGLTITSITSNAVINKRTEASLAAAAVAINQGWNKYRGEVLKTFGVDGNNKVVTQMAKDDSEKVNLNKYKNDGRKIYYEEHLGFFLANPEKIALAYANMNQFIHTESDERHANGCVRFEDFIRISEATAIGDVRNGIEALNDDSTFNKEWLSMGWSYDYLKECYSSAWIHMNYVKEVIDGDVHYTIISFAEAPIYEVQNYECKEEALSIYYNGNYPDSYEGKFDTGYYSESQPDEMEIEVIKYNGPAEDIPKRGN
jgi:hypothetical protein